MSEEMRNKTIGDVEQSLYSNIMELGRRLIQQHIDDRGVGQVAKAIEREDGKKLSHKRLVKRHLETLFGKVEIDRVGYSNRGESSIFPKDDEMSLPTKSYSYPVQQKVCREAIRLSYDEISETLTEYTGAHVPKRQSIETVQNVARDFESFYRERSCQDIEVKGKILVFSGDGKGVPMRKEGLREETRKRATSKKLSTHLSKGEKRNRKREALVASVYNVSPHIRRVDDIMNEFFSRKKSSTKPPRPENKRVWASLAKEKEEVFKEMAHEGQGRTGGVKNAAFLCDGAKVLQDLAKKHLSHNWQAIGVSFLIILDIIHVLGYLWSAAFAFYSEGDHQAEAWVGKYLRMILEGKVSVVVSAIRRSATCRNLKGEKRKAVDKATEYFLNNKSYMKYDDYLKLGLPIASGVIEGTCKHLVKNRFEISGARWGLDGAEALLKLRAIYQSGDWQSYWNYHTACEHQRLHPKEHWKPLTDENSLPKLRVIQGGKSSKK